MTEISEVPNVAHPPDLAMDEAYLLAVIRIQRLVRARVERAQLRREHQADFEGFLNAEKDAFSEDSQRNTEASTSQYATSDAARLRGFSGGSVDGVPLVVAEQQKQQQREENNLRHSDTTTGGADALASTAQSVKIPTPADLPRNKEGANLDQEEVSTALEKVLQENSVDEVARPQDVDNVPLPAAAADDEEEEPGATEVRESVTTRLTVNALSAESPLPDTLVAQIHQTETPNKEMNTSQSQEQEGTPSLIVCSPSANSVTMTTDKPACQSSTRPSTTSSTATPASRPNTHQEDKEDEGKPLSSSISRAKHDSSTLSLERSFVAPPPLLTEPLEEAAAAQQRQLENRRQQQQQQKEPLATHTNDFYTRALELLMAEETGSREEVNSREATERAPIGFEHGRAMDQYRNSRLQIHLWLQSDIVESERTRREQLEKEEAAAMWKIRDTADELEAQLPHSPSAALNALYTGVQRRKVGGRKGGNSALPSTLQELPDSESHMRLQLRRAEERERLDLLQEIKNFLERSLKLAKAIRHTEANEFVFRAQWESEWESWWDAILHTHNMELVLTVVGEETARRVEMQRGELHERYYINTHAALTIDTLWRLQQLVGAEQASRNVIEQNADIARALLREQYTLEQQQYVRADANGTRDVFAARQTQLRGAEANARMELHSDEMAEREQLFHLKLSIENVLTGGKDALGKLSDGGYVYPEAATEDFSLYSPRRRSINSVRLTDTTSVVTVEQVYRQRLENQEALDFAWIIEHAATRAASALRIAEVHRRDLVAQAEQYEFRICVNTLMRQLAECELRGVLDGALSALADQENKISELDTLVTVEGKLEKLVEMECEERARVVAAAETHTRAVEDHAKESNRRHVALATDCIDHIKQIFASPPSLPSATDRSPSELGADSSVLLGSTSRDINFSAYETVRNRQQACKEQRRRSRSMVVLPARPRDFRTQTQAVSQYVQRLRHLLCRAYRLDTEVDYQITESDFLDSVNIMGTTISVLLEGDTVEDANAHHNLWCNADLYDQLDALIRQTSHVAPLKNRSFVAHAGTQRGSTWLRLEDCCSILLTTLYTLNCQRLGHLVADGVKEKKEHEDNQKVGERQATAISDALVDTWGRQYITYGLSRLLHDQTLSHSLVLRSTFELFSMTDTRRMPFEPFEALFLRHEPNVAQLCRETNIAFSASPRSVMRQVGVSYMAFALLLRHSGCAEFSLARLEHLVQPMVHPDQALQTLIATGRAASCSMGTSSSAMDKGVRVSVGGNHNSVSNLSVSEGNGDSKVTLLLPAEEPSGEDEDIGNMAPHIPMSFVRRGADCIASVVGAHTEFVHSLRTVGKQLASVKGTGTGTTPAEYFANIIERMPSDSIRQLAAECLLILVLFTTSLCGSANSSAGGDGNKVHGSSATNHSSADSSKLDWQSTSFTSQSNTFSANYLELWTARVFKISHEFYCATGEEASATEMRAVCADVCALFYDFFLTRTSNNDTGVVFLRYLESKSIAELHEVSMLQQQMSFYVQEKQPAEVHAARKTFRARTASVIAQDQYDKQTQEMIEEETCYSEYPGGNESFNRVITMISKCLGVVWLNYAADLDGVVTFYSQAHLATTSVALDAAHYQRVQSGDGYGRYEHFQEAIRCVTAFNSVLHGAMGYLQALWTGSRWIRTTVRENTGVDVVNSTAPETEEEASKWLADAIIAVWPHHRRERVPFYPVGNRRPQSAGATVHWSCRISNTPPPTTTTITANSAAPAPNRLSPRAVNRHCSIDSPITTITTLVGVLGVPAEGIQPAPRAALAPLVPTPLPSRSNSSDVVPHVRRIAVSKLKYNYAGSANARDAIAASPLRQYSPSSPRSISAVFGGLLLPRSQLVPVVDRDIMQLSHGPSGRRAPITSLSTAATDAPAGAMNSFSIEDRDDWRLRGPEDKLDSREFGGYNFVSSLPCQSSHLSSAEAVLAQSRSHISASQQGEAALRSLTSSMSRLSCNDRAVGQKVVVKKEADLESSRSSISVYEL